MAKASITESSSFGKPDKIDRENNVIRGVKILGLESANGRVYPKAVIERALSQYEGRRVFVDHVSPDNPKRARSYSEQIGVIRKPVMRDDGAYGDFHYNPKHPQSEQMLYDAEKNPDIVGFSHHADIDQKRTGQKMTVESIYRVRSVDLVCEPATTNGLFEGKEFEPMKKTLKEVIEGASAEQRGNFKILEDMMGGGAMAPTMPVESADDSDAQIKAAFESAILAKFRDESLDYKGTVAAIKTILKAYDSISGAGGSPVGGDGDGGGKKPANESIDALRAELEVLKRRDEVRTLAVAEKVQLSEIDLDAAVALESAEKRTAFVKSRPKVTATEGRGGPQKPERSGSAADADTVTESAPAFKTNEERLRFLRGN